MADYIIHCAWCIPKEERKAEISYGICFPCVEKFFPAVAVKIKKCKSCKNKILSCNLLTKC